MLRFRLWSDFPGGLEARCIHLRQEQVEEKIIEWDEKSDNFLGESSQILSTKNTRYANRYSLSSSIIRLSKGIGSTKEEDIPKLDPKSTDISLIYEAAGPIGPRIRTRSARISQFIKDGNRLNVAGRGDFLRLTATMMALHHYIDIEDPEQGNFTPEHYGSYDLDDEIESGREMVRLLRNDLKGNLPRKLERQAITASSDFGLWLAATEDKTSEEISEVVGFSTLPLSPEVPLFMAL